MINSVYIIKQMQIAFCDIYSNGNAFFNLKNAAGNAKITMNAGVGSVYTETAGINIFGPYSAYRIFNSSGYNVVDLRSGNSDDGLFIYTEQI